MPWAKTRRARFASARASMISRRRLCASSLMFKVMVVVSSIVPPFLSHYSLDSTTAPAWPRPRSGEQLAQPPGDELLVAFDDRVDGQGDRVVAPAADQDGRVALAQRGHDRVDAALGRGRVDPDPQ